MERQLINLSDKLSKFSEHWSPKIVAQVNDYHLKLVKFQGEFGTVNTGDVTSDKTAPTDAWV